MLQARAGHPRAVHLCNAYTLSLALRSPSYREALNAGDLKFADGHPVAAVGRRLGHHNMHARVYGPDLMLSVIDRGRKHGLRHFLYGGAPGVADELAERLGQMFPGVLIVGTECPPFRPLSADEDAAVCRRIRDARPDVVWVGLGTPRQDEFVAKHSRGIDATLVAIGAAFDFLSGTKPQAPLWLQRHGLEWAFRLLMEPRRLWKRYLIGNSLFLLGLARDALTRARQ